jgi:oligopeptide transport system permease protein
MERSNSPARKIWIRFKRNKPALGGLIFIILLLIMGILGYVMTPDQTPMANSMHLQLSNKKPGRTFQFLVISAKENVPQVSFLEKMMYGQESGIKSIPISDYRISGNRLLVKEYIGDDEQSAESSYPITGNHEEI